MVAKGELRSYTLRVGLIYVLMQLQWTLANPKSLGPQLVQISKIFGLGKSIVSNGSWHQQGLLASFVSHIKFYDALSHAKPCYNS